MSPRAFCICTLLSTTDKAMPSYFLAIKSTASPFFICSAVSVFNSGITSPSSPDNPEYVLFKFFTAPSNVVIPDAAKSADAFIMLCISDSVLPAAASCVIKPIVTSSP